MLMKDVYEEKITPFTKAIPSWLSADGPPRKTHHRAHNTLEQAGNLRLAGRLIQRNHLAKAVGSTAPSPPSEWRLLVSAKIPTKPHSVPPLLTDIFHCTEVFGSEP